MRAMDFISSTDICYMICDTLSLIDERPIEHGMRVAYMLMRMLEQKGDYDEYEVAEFLFLAMIHDIGAYKTGAITEDLDYDEEKSSNPHAVYGSLFLKNTSPFGLRSDIIMYHHLPYSKINRMNYKYSKIAMYLRLLEDVDTLYRREGRNIDYNVFENGVGDKYLPEAVMLLLKCARKDGMLEHIISGEYKDELHKYMEYTLFTNAEKENLMRFVAHCYSLKTKMLTVEALMCCSIAEGIADGLDLTLRDKEVIGFSALLHDVGLLSVDKKLLKEEEGELSQAEKAAIAKHVNIGLHIYRKYFLEKEVVDIIAAHHEQMDGSGYPNGLRKQQMTQMQYILQTADSVMTMMNKTPHRPAMSKDEIINILLKMADRERMDELVVHALWRRYDKIEEQIQMETKEYLAMHMRINNKYKLLVDSNLGEEI